MAEGKRYYWLKLHEDFFGSKRIKKLRRLPGGDAFTIIYLKMQLKSIKTGGRLYYTGLEETFAEELALDLDEPADAVEIVLRFLLANDLAEENGDAELFLPFAAEAIGSESASTIRSRECRARQKTLHCNTNATQVQQICSGEIEIEKEIDKELEKEEEREEEAKPKAEAVPFSQIQSFYNGTCTQLAPIRSIQGKREVAVRARWNEWKKLETFIELFRKTSASAFLNGDNQRGWKADFDWLMIGGNASKVLEGRYDDDNRAPKQEEKQPAKETTFETDDFFNAALRATYGDDFQA